MEPFSSLPSLYLQPHLGEGLIISYKGRSAAISSSYDALLHTGDLTKTVVIWFGDSPVQQRVSREGRADSGCALACPGDREAAIWNGWKDG